MARKQKTPEPPAREPIATSWRGESVYRCPFCARDSDRAEAIQEHIDRDHPAVEQEVTDGATDTDQDDGAGAEPDGGRGRDDDGGQHDG